MYDKDLHWPYTATWALTVVTVQAKAARLVMVYFMVERVIVVDLRPSKRLRDEEPENYRRRAGFIG